MAAVTRAFNRANVGVYVLKQSNLRPLAEETGGGVIARANDLVGELGKIADEQEDRYVLAFTPGEEPEGSCHSLRLTVTRPGISVRSRQGYCSSPPADLLAGDTAGKALEARATGASAGNIAASLQLSYFYRSSTRASVNVAMEIATAGIRFQKVNGRPHAELKVVGLAYAQDGSAAGRFSDAVMLNFANDKEAAAFGKRPYYYQHQFDLAAGQYTVRVAFQSGESNFGKAESQLAIEPWDGRRLALSGIVLARESRPAPDLAFTLGTELLEERRPLVAGSQEIVPSGDNRFHADPGHRPDTTRLVLSTETARPSHAPRARLND